MLGLVVLLFLVPAGLVFHAVWEYLEGEGQAKGRREE
jgi:hypothetical protein